jgi:diacylglycerol kinase family enzyme
VAATPEQTPDGFLVIANARAGSAAREAVDAAADRLRASAPADVVWTETADDLDEVVRRLDGRRVVVAGGDGSLHAVVAALHRQDLRASCGAVGLLPLGTGNDLARTLGLPADAAAAAEVVVSGRDRPLDLIVDDAGGIAVNAVHLGVGADGAATGAQLKSLLGSGAYAVGSAVAAVRTRGWALGLEVDGVRVTGEAADNADTDEPERLLMVGLANGRSIGGGTELAPDAQPDDGQMDVVVVGATGPLARLGYGLALRRGRHDAREDVEVLRGRQVMVEATAPGEEFPLNADGEVSGPVYRRTWTVEPGAWAVRVPT